MNKLGLFLQKFALDYVVKYLKNNKEQVIKSANAKVAITSIEATKPPTTTMLARTLPYISDSKSVTKKVIG